jgi:hypothetical protein
MLVKFTSGQIKDAKNQLDEIYSDSGAVGFELVTGDYIEKDSLNGEQITREKIEDYLTLAEFDDSLLDI